MLILKNNKNIQKKPQLNYIIVIAFNLAKLTESYLKAGNHSEMGNMKTA